MLLLAERVVLDGRPVTRYWLRVPRWVFVLLRGLGEPR